MTSTAVRQRIKGFCQRTATHSLFTRPVAIPSQKPFISFTFDDFPRSAWLTGGAILERFGVRGTYYASLGGVSRWQEGQLRNWSENEGLASELVHAIARGSDGTFWAATSEGLARFDGENWRSLGTTELVTRGLATDDKGRIWVATGKGLRMLPPAAAGAGVGADPGAAPVILAGDMRDVAVDRFGRIWPMSTTSIALVAEK